MYSAGQIAKLVGVSKRTILYYDETGLLQPSQRDSAGQRWYNEQDIQRLHKILFLKSMNYSLKQITTLLDQDQALFKDTLTMQLQMLEEKISELEQIKHTTQAVLNCIDLENRIDWELLFKLMQRIQWSKEENSQMLSNYFTQEEQHLIQSLPKLGDQSRRSREWTELIQKIKQHMHEGPSSPMIQQLAQEWQTKAEALFQGNHAFIQKVRRYLDEEDEYPLDKAFIQFMQEALTILKKRQSEGKGDVNDETK